MKKFCVVLIVFFALLFSANADEIVYTKEGKKVLLRDDGTWIYVKENSKDAATYHFRQTKWRMSRKLVKTSETAKLV